MAVWDTKSIPAGEQFDYYREVICRAFVPLLPIAEGKPDRFESAVDTRTMGDLNRARVSAPMQKTHHGPAEVAATGDEFYFVNLQLQGRCRAQQGATDSVIEPGQFTVLDTSRPFYLEFDRDWQMLSFRLPRAYLDTQMLGRDVPLGTQVRSSGAAAAVPALMNALWSVDEATPNEVAGSMLASFAAAVAGALLGSAEVAQVPRDAHLRALVQQHLLAHLADPGLSVMSVSRDFGISPRTLHSLFEREDHTFAATLRGLRMTRAEQLLRTTSLSVTAVGEQVGYPDPSSFGRAFRGANGESPLVFRMLHEL